MVVRAVEKPVKAKRKKKAYHNRTARKKRLIIECRSICSEICKILWKKKCATCNNEGTAAHHFFGWKACSNVRFNFDNLIWLCGDCHARKVHQQGITEPAREAIVARIGERDFEELYREAFKPAEYDLESTRKRLGLALIYYRHIERKENEQQMPRL